MTTSLARERRRRLMRAARSALSLRPVRRDVRRAPADAILLFSVIRNEAPRLPFFFEHYRALGVGHFCMLDNGSTDGGPYWLMAQPDVSLWTTAASYRRARYGIDWLNWLLGRYGHGRWCLIVDIDEFLTYPHDDSRGLRALTGHLADSGRESMAAMLVDLYGDRPADRIACAPGQSPIEAAPWFDAGNYCVARNPRYGNLWIQGGPRMRSLFADAPADAPSLNKTPLVRWRRGYALISSTHMLSPPRLNRTYGTEGEALTGALLHAKFVDALPGKVAEELARREHFAASREYLAYDAHLRAGGSMMAPWSRRFEGWRSLVEAGLMSPGEWV